MTYRAAYTRETMSTGELVLTGPEHSHLSADELIREALAEASRAGLDICADDIEIGIWRAA